MNEFDCDKLGPIARNGFLRDRTFTVIRASNNEFVSARTYPTMVLIKPKFKSDQVMTLSAPEMEEIEININELLNSSKLTEIQVWKDKAEVVDCGDEIANWFSRFLLKKDEGFRLVFYKSRDPKSKIAKRVKKFKAAEGIDTGTLQDETSFMFMNMSSFDDLNSKIEKPVTPLQYRPNFVISGPKAWEEDNFKWIKVGNDAIFKRIEPCLRCVFTTIDPVTGIRDKNEQPLKTLRSFRLFDNIGKSPVFGAHIGLRAAGKVKSGDPVYIPE